MKKHEKPPHRFSSISELARVLGLSKPLNPLVSFVDNSKISVHKAPLPSTFVLDFYKISYKTGLSGKIKYGQSYYDFDEGGMVFTSPGQLLAVDDETEYKGYTLLVHPDFIRGHALGRAMKSYGFFSYDTNEALHLSDKEKAVIMGIFKNIEDELQSAIDDFSQTLIISYIEVLLNYSNRFYRRQFITRKAVNHDLLVQMESLLQEYFEQDESQDKGLPTVEYLAGRLNLSPRYLSDMLRSLTGQNAQQHIQDMLIEKAKQYLTSTSLSVAEIAYQLGFGHPQSFNKLFKKKTNLTPIAFKHSFN